MSARHNEYVELRFIAQRSSYQEDWSVSSRPNSGFGHSISVGYAAAS
jgi:hypothetical protein